MAWICATQRELLPRSTGPSASPTVRPAATRTIKPASPTRRIASSADVPDRQALHPPLKGFGQPPENTGARRPTVSTRRSTARPLSILRRVPLTDFVVTWTDFRMIGTRIRVTRTPFARHSSGPLWGLLPRQVVACPFPGRREMASVRVVRLSASR